jgi:predicted nucleic acid-binding protein
MTAVFLDTVGLLARWDSTDQWHDAAKWAYTSMLAQRRLVITTTFVLLECGNAASRRPYRSLVARFRQEMQAGGRVVVPTETDWQAAWAAYARGDAANAGIVDHVSFAVMRRLGITDAFTNDRHFRAAGFKTLF